MQFRSIICCAMVFVWLGTLGQRQRVVRLHRRAKQCTDQDTLCATTRAALGDDSRLPPPGHVLGLAEVAVAFRYGPLQYLAASERAQLRYWESFLGGELANRLVLLRVERVYPFEEPRLFNGLLGRQSGSGAEVADVEANDLAARV